MEIYRQMYNKSVENPEEFWMDLSKDLYWKSYSKKPFLSYNFNKELGPIHIKWMEGMVTNVCYNVLDRLIDKGLGDRIAYHWEGNDSYNRCEITYNQLKSKVCKFANVLKRLGVRKGMRIAIYMSVTIDLVVAMLACARIGAIHTVVFAGFSSEALAERIIDANCVVLITSDGTFRAKKFIPLKDISDSALNICQQKGHKIIACVVNRNLNLNSVDNELNDKNPVINWNKDLDICWTEQMNSVDDNCEPVWVDSEDPLFILYTSGSTGKPKGVLHTTGGYLIYTYITFKYVFDFTDGDVFFSTADLGWITGHSFTVYGPLANGATIVLLEGTPLYPDPGRLWQIVERLKVNIFFTAPTAIRSLMRFGEQYVKRYNRDSLRVLGVAGEAINPEAWHWYHNVVGNGKAVVVDNYWQTETAGPMITSLPSYTPPIPGSATLPFFGVVPAIVDSNGKELEGVAVGHLVYKNPWPGIARTIDGKHDLYEKTYFEKFNGYYWTGDDVRRDSDGFYWITGRIDDTLNVSGHLLSTVEVETAIVEHMAVAEVAAVSVPHPLKGHCICVFVVLNNGFILTHELTQSIKQRARAKIGALAEPDIIQSLSSLPKTKSGKIMRRILNIIARGERDLGDTSTLVDDSILDELFKLTIA